MNDAEKKLLLLKSMVSDLETQLFSNQKLGTEHVKIAHLLVNSEDAKKLFNKDFLTDLQSHVTKCKISLVKNAQLELSILEKAGE